MLPVPRLEPVTISWQQDAAGHGETGPSGIRPLLKPLLLATHASAGHRRDLMVPGLALPPALLGQRDMWDHEDPQLGSPRLS